MKIKPMYLLLLSLYLVFVIQIEKTYAQYTMHNFTVIDSDGRSHNLYTSHLDKGKTVVLKFFFTTCPPCIAISPQWQSKYVAWGSGTKDVEFIEASILSSDKNADVKAFKQNYIIKSVC